MGKRGLFFKKEEKEGKAQIIFKIETLVEDLMKDFMAEAGPALFEDELTAKTMVKAKQLGDLAYELAYQEIEDLETMRSDLTSVKKQLEYQNEKLNDLMKLVRDLQRFEKTE